MKVLVTGGAGYVGSILVGKLLEQGYKVKVLDCLLFGDNALRDYKNNPNFELIIGDIRSEDCLKNELKGEIGAVVHLAAIVGDPACAAQQEVAVDVNFNSTIKLAKICKKKKINRFIFASTCSVYGAGKGILTENSALNPISLYAETRLNAEKEIRLMADTNFQPTILRFATVYGLSRRMRFDLVVNLLAKKAAIESAISIFGGDQWRPFVHVTDVVQAIATCLAAPERAANQTFNVGSTTENYKLKSLGPLFSDVYPNLKVVYVDKINDPRSYRVCCDKINKTFGFKTKMVVKDGIKEIKEAIETKRIMNPEESNYYNYRVY